MTAAFRDGLRNLTSVLSEPGLRPLLNPRSDDESSSLGRRKSRPSSSSASGESHRAHRAGVCGGIAGELQFHLALRRKGTGRAVVGDVSRRCAHQHGCFSAAWAWAGNWAATLPDSNTVMTAIVRYSIIKRLLPGCCLRALSAVLEET